MGTCIGGRRHRWKGAGQRDPCLRCNITRYDLVSPLVKSKKIVTKIGPVEAVKGDPYLLGYESFTNPLIKNRYDPDGDKEEKSKWENFEDGRREAEREHRLKA